MTKGTLGKDRTTWIPKVKRTTKCLDVPVTLAIYHADILPLWLISFFFFSSCLYCLCMQSITELWDLAQHPFCPGAIYIELNSLLRENTRKWPMWVVHCTQCLYGHEFTLINTRSALSNESGKDMRNWKQKSLCSSCTYSKKQEKAGCCQLSICIYSKWDWIPLKIWVLFVTAFLTGGGWSCTKVRQRVFERSFPLMCWIVLLMRLTDTHRDLEYQKQVTEVCKTDLTFFQYIWKENLFKAEVRHWGQPICYPKG